MFGIAEDEKGNAIFKGDNFCLTGKLEEDTGRLEVEIDGLMKQKKSLNIVDEVSEEFE